MVLDQINLTLFMCEGETKISKLTYADAAAAAAVASLMCSASGDGGDDEGICMKAKSESIGT